MNFEKESKSEKKLGVERGGGSRGGKGGEGRVLKPKQYASSGELKSNHLHNVKHAVQPTFQNKLITF